MRKIILLTTLALALLLPTLAAAKGEDGCTPRAAAITATSVVKFQGTGDMDITVITDPLCWHCRLGHKLLNEYPHLYKTVHMVFFPRRSFIGSDMAAWILHDNAGKANSKALIDFAYKGLKKPKTEDLAEARDIILTQFLFTFPELLDGTSIEELSARLQKDHEADVLKSAATCRAVKLPGTPVLMAGKYVLVGYGAGPWIEALKKQRMCE